ncbi:piggyBac transposable element-derived protein 4 [Odontesthes bonariensis]|uniref:piggyBac transposable element-derived protein 4 n=1 Tax=Odontesthes bonariensis TaxID=219752 RepID=UPI003F58AE6E
MSPAEAAQLIQEQLALESESDDALSDLSSDDEDVHFELRIDPAEDDVENIPPAPARKRARSDVENIPPAPARRRAQTKQRAHSWKTERDADAPPPPQRFLPAREPGVQLRAEDNHTPLDLFKLFFSENVVQTLCRNTNKQAAAKVARGAKYRWVDVGVAEFYQFLGLMFYTSMLKVKHVTDYWRRNTIFSIPFPAQTMARDRYRTIFWNLHISDPDEDRENDAKKGTSAHDKLFCVKPLMDTIRNVCKAFYHPRRNISVGERMVASRCHAMRQYMKDKPTKWGFKLFVLADSSNGYTVNFSVYTGKNNFPMGHGLSYDSVMTLTDKGYLGSGYNVFMDNFYTSPKLFKDLHDAKFGACGTYRESRRDCPRSSINALAKHSPRGEMRWIRDGPVVYVKWMDTREVSVCSTIHAAYTGDAVQRRVKSKQGLWSRKSVPCPKPVIEYNKHMGGVDLSNQLLQYYTTQHETVKWYKKLFLHFLDIASTNAYILHKELMQSMHKKSMTHKQFIEKLTAELCGVSLHCEEPKAPPKEDGRLHLPVCRAGSSTDGKRASDGRRRCVYCIQQGKAAGPAEESDEWPSAEERSPSACGAAHTG